MTEEQEGRRPCRVRVVVPHYFHQGPEPIGYGSTRADSLLERQVALCRCLGGLLALNRAEQDELLLIDRRAIACTAGSTYPERRLSGVQVELHVFVTGDRQLAPLLQHYGPWIQVHPVELEDPRHLPQAARRFLLESEPEADLYLYLEDDLVVGDRLFADGRVPLRGVKSEARMPSSEGEQDGMTGCHSGGADAPRCSPMIRDD